MSQPKSVAILIFDDVVAKLLGKAKAVETAEYMEYDWKDEF